MMPLNWLLEALKWKFLVRPFSQISVSKALEAVFSGLTFGFATPRSLGDYFGRIIFLDVSKRTIAILPTVISRISQLVPTLVFGIVGVTFLLGKMDRINIIGTWCLILLLAIGLIFYLNSKKWKGLFNPGKVFKSIQVSYKWTEQLRVLTFSFLRYSVFTLQFLFVLEIMGSDASWLLLFAGVSWIFLAKSILPSFNFLSDLGIREFSAILFFEAYGLPLEPVLSASIFIWIINILFPSILGLFIIGKSKFDLW